MVNKNYFSGLGFLPCHAKALLVTATLGVQRARKRLVELSIDTFLYNPIPCLIFLPIK